MIVSIKNLMTGYKEKLFSPTEITKWYLERIRKLDPEINSYITITEEVALQHAREAEDKMNSGNFGRLLGVPISYKDSIDTKGILTTNGSRIDKKRIPNENAAIATQLRQEGIILLGKNNMYEYSAGIVSENPYFGNIINQWDKAKTAGGSSGGSAAAVAANLCLGSIATDTSGSIRVPAACCGVIGVKPTYNLLSMKGINSFSWTLTHAGVIAGNVEDAAIILQTMTGVSYRNMYSAKLKGVRIGIPKFYFNEGIDIKVSKMYEKAIQQMVELGATLVEVDTSFIADTVKVSRTIGTSELGVAYKEQIDSISHLYNEEMQNTFKSSQMISAFDYIDALQKKEEWMYKVSEMFLEVDVIITPTMPIVTPNVDAEMGVYKNESLGDCMVRYTNVFNITGHPALALPAGKKETEAPLGLQLVADYNREDNLFHVGYAYEQYALTSFLADRQLRF